MTNSLGMTFVCLPAGTFWMGDRGRQKRVTIAHEFYLATHPVTQGQWQAVTGSNPSWFSRRGGGAAQVKDIPDSDLMHFPVECVSWDDVQRFLKKLNAREKKAGFRYRLPTEAEWEYACREGASTKKACAFDYYLAQPTNDLSSRQANFIGRYPGGHARRGKDLQRTTKVGSYEPNRLGLYDMHGNVLEWCEDADDAAGSVRVLRGGSWGGAGSGCRASSRHPYARSAWNVAVGFRLVAVPARRRQAANR